MSDLQAIKPEKLRILQDITEGIKNGELAHIQEAYHCGTSHCLAGWIELHALKQLGLSTTFNRAGYWIKAGVCKQASPIIEAYCQERNILEFEAVYAFARDYIGLNSVEAELLFIEDAIFSYQAELVNLLAEGYRVPPITPDLFFEYTLEGLLYVYSSELNINKDFYYPSELRALAMQHFPQFKVLNSVENPIEDLIQTK